MNDDLVNYLRALANGVMHWVTVERMAREAVDRIEALEAALRRWSNYGCPDCGGDCGGANPPVVCCIMLETRKALEGKDD
jgi:rubrerythrin